MISAKIDSFDEFRSHLGEEASAVSDFADEYVFCRCPSGNMEATYPNTTAVDTGSPFRGQVWGGKHDIARSDDRTNHAAHQDALTCRGD